MKEHKERTELQNYIIKRQYIKHVELLSEEYTDQPIFESKNNMHTYANYNHEFTLTLNTSLLKPPVITNAIHTPEKLEVSDDLWDFQYKFEDDVVILAQWLLLNVTPDQIITGHFTNIARHPRYTLPEIHITREFLQWDFPSIKEIVIAYLNDDAWKKYILPFASFSEVQEGFPHSIPSEGYLEDMDI